MPPRPPCGQFRGGGVAVDLDAINQRVKQESRFVEALRAEVSRTIVGQAYLVDRLLIALLCDGHILIEGVPGLAKTLSVSTIAQTMPTQTWAKVSEGSANLRLRPLRIHR